MSVKTRLDYLNDFVGVAVGLFPVDHPLFQLWLGCVLSVHRDPSELDEPPLCALRDCLGEVDDLEAEVREELVEILDHFETDAAVVRDRLMRLNARDAEAFRKVIPDRFCREALRELHPDMPFSVFGGGDYRDSGWFMLASMRNHISGWERLEYQVIDTAQTRVVARALMLRKAASLTETVLV